MQRMRAELQRGSLIEDAAALVERAASLFTMLGFSPTQFQRAFMGSPSS